MTTFANIQDEIAAMLTALDDADEQTANDSAPALLAYLDELAQQEASKADAVAYADRRAQAEIDFLKGEEARLAARRRSLETRRANFREYIKAVFATHNLQKVTGHNATISLRKNPASVDIAVPVHELPSEFVQQRIDYVVDKRALAYALKNGASIPGVHLRQSESIQIR